MATTPSGSPPWVRSNDHTSYGGHAEKKNYNDIPIVNPKTDVGAEHLVRIATDLAAVARMSNFATMRFEMASGASAPIVYECSMMTGLYTGSGYNGTSPPTGFPRVTGVSDGVADVHVSGAYTDPYSVSATFQPAFCGATMADYAAGVEVFSWVSGTDVVRVRVQTTSGSGAPLNNVCVWIA